MRGQEDVKKIGFREETNSYAEKLLRLNALQAIFGVWVYIFDQPKRSKKSAESIFSQLPDRTFPAFLRAKQHNLHFGGWPSLSPIQRG
jgi:hypothetical protein